MRGYVVRRCWRSYQRNRNANCASRLSAIVSVMVPNFGVLNVRFGIWNCLGVQDVEEPGPELAESGLA